MSEQQRPRPTRRIGSNRSRIAETVRALITSVADELGYLLWNVEYVKEGADMILRITIDKPEGIGIDDCERMTRAIDPLLDEADPIEESYLLEVSSPGIERELSRPEHFEACAGEEVELRLFAPVEGSKVWRGVLIGLDEQSNIVIETPAGQMSVPPASVSRVKTVFEF